ncbi:MAG: acyl-CoA dehydrogenase family protein [Chloroflexota bacterium]
MNLDLSGQQKAFQDEFRTFVNDEIRPYADAFDTDGRIPRRLIGQLAERRYLGGLLPEEIGGLGKDAIVYGLLHEEVGRGCSSVRSLLTVHGMVGQAITRWGTNEQQAKWLPRLATGNTIGAFALSEPEAGSDPSGITSTATPQPDGYVVNGCKRWITFGQIADLFLLYVQVDGRPSALLVEKGSPGLEIVPIHNVMGTKASMIAELRFTDCFVPKENLVSKEGFGLTAVAATALGYGRYSVACGCVGIGQACLDESRSYVGKRQQFGAYLKDHQLVQQMITNMITNVKAARLLCYQAGHLMNTGSPHAMTETFVAKYFASTMASQAASDAVQLHGAIGCSHEHPTQRFYRDAKVMEIIEGSTQIQQMFIAQNC